MRLTIADAIRESAPVTSLGPRAGLTVAIVLFLVLCFTLMARNWRRRMASQADILPLDPPAAVAGGEVCFGPVKGTYVGTVTAGNWLDRVAIHGLGHRGPVGISLTTAGLLVSRVGAEPESTDEDEAEFGGAGIGHYYIAYEAMTAVSRERALAGRIYRGGIVVIDFQAGPRSLAIGLRARRSVDQQQLFEALRLRIDQAESSWVGRAGIDQVSADSGGDLTDSTELVAGTDLAASGAPIGVRA